MDGVSPRVAWFQQRFKPRSVIDASDGIDRDFAIVTPPVFTAAALMEADVGDNVDDGASMMLLMYL
jgi:hypothetical protein